MPKINDFDSEAQYYDLFEKKNQPSFNLIVDFLEKLFKKNNSKTILDVTCGTGAQAIPLAKRGFQTVGSDIGKKLLTIARRKSKGVSNIKLVHGDVRYTKFGKFDAVISMLNSLGYLNKKDFRKALININSNLKEDGLLVFDNTNKTCLDIGNFTADKIIDTAGEDNRTKFVRFCKSKYDKKSGIITTKWETVIQRNSQKPLEASGIWKRQTYTIEDLKSIFRQTGFQLENVYDRSLEKFEDRKSFSYLIVARKTSALGK